MTACPGAENPYPLVAHHYLQVTQTGNNRGQIPPSAATLLVPRRFRSARRHAIMRLLPGGSHAHVYFHFSASVADASRGAGVGADDDGSCSEDRRNAADFVSLHAGPRPRGD